LPRDLAYDCSYWNSPKDGELERDACELFKFIDLNGDNRASREEFVTGLTQAPNVDLFEMEAGRLFDGIDTDGAGFIDREQFTNVIFEYI
jgi:Ca2+-binding EF-hand superfamily protein